MTERTTKHLNISELGYTYGLEIENTISDNEALRDALCGAFNCSYSVERVHSGTAYNVRGWMVEDDGSVNGCELVSPILSYEQILTELPIVLNCIHALQGSADNSCGFHIHIGHKNYNLNDDYTHHGFTVHTLKNLINLVSVRDTILRGACRVTYRSDWCKRYTDKFLEAVKSAETIADIKECYYWNLGDADGYASGYYNRARYYLLNLHCLFGPRSNGTIEFRLFNGTVNFEKIKAYVDLCSAMVDMAERQNRISDAKESREKAEVENPKYSFRTFINKLGLIGDAFKSTRKVLRMSLSGVSNSR